MTRVKAFDLAREIAEEKSLAYGLGITDGMYYIGTTEQLDKIPVVIKFSYEKTVHQTNTLALFGG
jgi:hypothetical protein